MNNHPLIVYFLLPLNSTQTQSFFNGKFCLGR